MDAKRRRNLTLLPFVLLVRAPILLPLFLLRTLGQLAGELGDWLGDRLPGLEP